MKIGDTGTLKCDVAPSLNGVRVIVRSISPLRTLRVELLEDAVQPSCWKKGEQIHVQPYQILFDQQTLI